LLVFHLTFFKDFFSRSTSDSFHTPGAASITVTLNRGFNR